MASETKRSTDGPWHYVPWHIAEGPSEVRHADGWLICVTPSDDSARLIAAAPDMLAALNRIAAPRGCGCVPCVGQCTSKEALEIEIDGIRDIARAAIAKATS